MRRTHTERRWEDGKKGEDEEEEDEEEEEKEEEEVEKKKRRRKTTTKAMANNISAIGERQNARLDRRKEGLDLRR